MFSLDLKYGCNPHQGNAKLLFNKKDPPLKVLNGSPSYINILDAFSAWQMVKELKKTLNIESAASFKHLSPAGAAIAKPLSDEFKKSQFINNLDLSPIAMAYLRARGGDRMCSFGDAISVSEEVDITLANIIKYEVSDLIIAPKFNPKALEILKSKKNGGYLILEIENDFEGPEIETRSIFGFTLEQNRNSILIDDKIFKKIVTINKTINQSVLQSLILATISLKYTQSNSICVAYDGQLVGVGAGQQSRVHCLRLACNKADKWFLQQHPKVLNLDFNDNLKKVDKTNCVDQYILWDELSENEKMLLFSNLKKCPAPLGRERRKYSLKITMEFAYHRMLTSHLEIILTEQVEAILSL